jgi:tryptophanase
LDYRTIERVGKLTLGTDSRSKYPKYTTAVLNFPENCWFCYDQEDMESGSFSTEWEATIAHEALEYCSTFTMSTKWLSH